MASKEQILSALRKAHDAGDTEGATRLAAMYKQSQLEQPEQPQLEKPGFMVGVGKGMADAITGITSLFGNEDPFNIGTGEAVNKANEAINNNTTSNIGQAVGNIAVSLPAALIPGANTIKGATLIGAGTGALLNKNDRTGNAILGGLGGAGGQVLGKSIPYVATLVNRVSAPFGGEEGKKQVLARMLKSVVGDNADRIATRLENTQSFVPGSMPTAAEGANSGGISAIQRWAAQANPEDYANRFENNAIARKNLLSRFAGTDEQITAAKVARSEAVKPLYKLSDESIANITPELSDILNRMPKGAIARAKEISRMNAEPFTYGQYVPERTVPSSILGINGLPIRATIIPAQNAQISGRTIDLLKKSIDDIAGGLPTASIGKESQQAALGVKGDLLNWADSGENMPIYAFARHEFQKRSKPITQLEIGKAMLEKASPALTNYGRLTRETPQMFARALNEGKQVAKKATGFSGSTLKNSTKPEQYAAYVNIAKDLARKANADQKGIGVGSNTFQNLTMQDIGSASGMPGAMISSLTRLPLGGKFISAIGNTLAKAATTRADKEMKDMLAEALLNPKKTAELLRMAEQQSLMNRLTQNKTLSAIPGIMGSNIAISGAK